MEKELVILGLGKMGAGLARQLLKKGWRVVGYNRSPEIMEELSKDGLIPSASIEEAISKLESKRKTVWVMVPSGAVEEVLFGESGVMNFLQEDDHVIEGGNSQFTLSKERFSKFEEKGIHFSDVGVSGGPGGALNGACMMIGGREEIFKETEELYKDLCVEKGYDFFPGAGAGHFVKMVHNGIEYGMMQAIAEGFSIMKESDYNLDLKKVCGVYAHGSVIESSLIDWLNEGYEKFGQDLTEVCPTIAHLGEGQWTVEKAQEMGIRVPVIAEAFKFRIESSQNPSYTGKVVMALRHAFGNHDYQCKK